MRVERSPAPNQVHFSPLPDGVTLMRASFADHAFERHSHDCFAIGVTAHGTQRFRCKGRQHDSRAGEFVLFNPDEDHDGSPGTADGFGYAIWYVPEAFVRSCADVDAGLSGNPYFAAPHIGDPRMAREFTRLSALLLAPPPEALHTETLLRRFIGTLLARHGERPQSTMAAPRGAGLEPLLRVKDYLRAHFARDVTVAELAAIAGLSRAHLTRAFTAAFHTPPHVYLNAVRIAHAQTLIRLGTPLATVAADCGFADQSHFTRRFKGSVGVAPADWRRTVCKGA
ncbi:AraC-like DNA-binding protein [Pseudoduganella lurida]|uniref:AraC-like DNA-binding protein n=1 Tax=Pseudoduganella lurida TaxID=1036180 RepID=A0A562RLM8_9BURK|nr:AraC family transcriptional regulator [Pseudoduganella lurida]TWI69803.1 AraC-like DNA-binding protein [Pseudoduganella lurida]